MYLDRGGSWNILGLINVWLYSNFALLEFRIFMMIFHESNKISDN